MCFARLMALYCTNLYIPAVMHQLVYPSLHSFHPTLQLPIVISKLRMFSLSRRCLLMLNAMDTTYDIFNDLNFQLYLLSSPTRAGLQLAPEAEWLEPCGTPDTRGFVRIWRRAAPSPTANLCNSNRTMTGKPWESNNLQGIQRLRTKSSL